MKLGFDTQDLLALQQHIHHLGVPLKTAQEAMVSLPPPSPEEQVLLDQMKARLRRSSWRTLWGLLP